MSDTDVKLERVLQMQHDGYIAVEHGHWILTELGWRALCAAATPRRKKPRRVTREALRQDLEAWRAVIR